jgi:hypothetical protein
VIDTAVKPTKRMVEFLSWMKSQGHVTMFPLVWGVMWRKANKAGLIEQDGGVHVSGACWVRWTLSDRGRELVR